jgi:hypothetical protein
MMQSGFELEPDTFYETCFGQRCSFVVSHSINLAALAARGLAET